MIDLEKILELEAKATFDPWIFSGISGKKMITGRSDEQERIPICEMKYFRMNDFDLIVEMRNNIKSICLELKAAREYFSRDKEAELMYLQGDAMGSGNAWQDCAELKKKYYEVVNGKG